MPGYFGEEGHRAILYVEDPEEISFEPQQTAKNITWNARKLQAQTWDSLTRKDSVERPFVNKQYELNSVSATFVTLCEHKFQEDHCLWTARARMLGCLLLETRSRRKNRNTTLRHGDVYWWKPMLLKLHSRWCSSSTPHRSANNALAMRFSVLCRNACCC